MALVDMALVPTHPVQTIFNSAAGIVGATPNESLVAQAPSTIYVSGLAAGTTVAVEVSPDGVTWFPHTVLDGAVGAALFTTIPAKQNFVKAIRTGVAPIVITAVV